jgi:hypothetical protein
MKHARLLLVLALFNLSLSLGAYAATDLLEDPDEADAHDALIDDPNSGELRAFSTPLNFGLDLQYSPIPYKNYTFGNGFGTDKASQGGHVGFEYIPMKNYGKLGFGLGFGFFVLPDQTTGTGDQAATLYTLPLEASISYRFDYVDNQILVPFIRAGADATLSKQGSRTNGVTRDGVRTYYGFDYSAGLELNLDFIEPRSAATMERKFGINNTYIIFEYMTSNAINKNTEPDLSYQAFRLGLRFEM